MKGVLLYTALRWSSFMTTSPIIKKGLLDWNKPNMWVEYVSCLKDVASDISINVLWDAKNVYSHLDS